MTSDLLNSCNRPALEKLLSVMGEMSKSKTNVNERLGGYLGLSHVAVAMAVYGHDVAASYSDELILPIMAGVDDSNTKHRQLAYEALYNTSKAVGNNSVHHFGALFAACSSGIASMDNDIKMSAEMLDRLLKDIVIHDPEFRVESFVTVARERLYSRSRFTAGHHLGWIRCLEDNAATSLVDFLPEIVDGVFFILEDDAKDIQIQWEWTR